jgi:hypothetical protein
LITSYAGRSAAAEVMSGTRIFDPARTMLLPAWMVRFDKLDVAKAVLPDDGRMVKFQAKLTRLSLPPELQIIASKLQAGTLSLGGRKKLLYKIKIGCNFYFVFFTW